MKHAGLTKHGLRSRIIPRLRIQKEEERKHKSKLIKDKLFASCVFRRAKIIMFYLSFGGEVETSEMIKEAQKLGKKIAVPVCIRDRIMIRPAFLCAQGRVVRGPYGIREPVAKEYIPAEKLDLVVVPGVAFDKKGNRLGRGKGYYDRFLRRLPASSRTVGLAFGFQILPRIPTTSDDVSVNRVIYA